MAAVAPGANPAATAAGAASPPVFEQIFRNARFAQGGNAHFEGKVRGNPTPQIIWTRKGMQMKGKKLPVLAREKKLSVLFSVMSQKCNFYSINLLLFSNGFFLTPSFAGPVLVGQIF